MSAFETPQDLPPYFRPRQFKGRGKLPVYVFEGALPASLIARRDPPEANHFVIEPTTQCTIEEYSAALAETRSGWRKAYDG